MSTFGRSSSIKNMIKAYSFVLILGGKITIN